MTDGKRSIRKIGAILAAAACAGLIARARTEPPAQKPRAAQPTASRVVHFSGYDWEVRPAGMGGPGPNRWDPSSVWVDARGWLHLRIRRAGDGWRCAEVSTRRRFGFGRYEFDVRGRIDRLDRNVVLGLFDYPPAAVGPDGTNEIDIEYSRWGNPASPIGSYTVYPARAGLPQASKSFDAALSGQDTTQRFVWGSRQVTFESLIPGGGTYARWDYRPADSRGRIPQQPTPVHLNLWLFQGAPPHDGREVEIVVRRFSFTAAEPG